MPPILSLLDVPRHCSFLALTLRDLLGLRPGSRSDDVHLQAAMGWLCRAQDATGTGGVSGGYSWLDGWQEPYPETTGYIIPTFLEYAAVMAASEYVDRAERMADWELSIQLPTGAIRGGIGVNTYPIVFNTGQVIQGLVAYYRHSGEAKYLDAACRAADWLVSIQDADGKWSQYTFNGIPHAYHTRVAWPVLQVFELTHEPRYRQAVEQHVRWVLGLADENGWIGEMAFKRGEDPVVHTIAYTLRGLLECARLLDGELVARLDALVLKACERLLMKYECRKSDPRGMPAYLAGTFAENWRPTARWSCLTGDAQMALIFLRLFEHGGDPRFLNAALKLIDQVKATQSLRAINPGIRGAVAGSYPLWGTYTRFGFPNWAAKFLVDAILLARKLVQREQEATR